MIAGAIGEIMINKRIVKQGKVLILYNIMRKVSRYCVSVYLTAPSAVGATVKLPVDTVFIRAYRVDPRYFQSSDRDFPPDRVFPPVHRASTCLPCFYLSTVDSPVHRGFTVVSLSPQSTHFYRYALLTLGRYLRQL